MSWELDYLNLIEQVITTGYFGDSRAGATYALPGESLKIPLDKGFPMITTRKMFPAGVIGELAGFLRGATNLATYEKYGCMYWSKNAANWPANEGLPREDWQIGRVYGAQWVNWQVPTHRGQPTPMLRPGIPATYLGIANGDGRNSEPALKAVWGNMIDRCYNPANKRYGDYGGRGVYVCNAWLEFKVFAADAKLLPNWDLKSKPGSKHQLDKDILGDSFVYSPKHCCWVSPEENNHYNDKKQYTLQHINGEICVFTSPSKFCKERGISLSGLCQLWTGSRNYSTAYGFRLLEVKEIGKFASINQLANVIDGIRKDPYSRRHIVTAWNPSELDQGVLPPCHIMFQFYVRRDELHCMVMMRSVDLCVGLPSDIILYALLTNLVAKDTGLKAKSLTFFFGDTHVYANHVDLFMFGQRHQEPQKSPTLLLAPGCTTLDFVPSDVQILDYQHGPVIKYPFNA